VGFSSLPAQNQSGTGASPAWSKKPQSKEKKAMTAFEHILERTIVICAERNTVFRFFKASKHFADWWGTGSTIEGKAGGKVHICYPNGVIASGEVIEFKENERITFTYGYESGKPIAAGSSRVTFTLRDHPEGTELQLRHEFSDAAIMEAHLAGWRYQLALFANVAAREQHAQFGDTADLYFQLWSLKDPLKRAAILEKIAVPEIRFSDAYGCVNSRDDFNAHIGAVQIHMPGLTLARSGELQQCQGTAIIVWQATQKDGSAAGSGTNIFELAGDGKIRRIVGFWNR
jgi:uncharacterized protein YndB with AHSA1/START domain